MCVCKCAFEYVCVCVILCVFVYVCVCREVSQTDHRCKVCFENQLVGEGRAETCISHPISGETAECDNNLASIYKFCTMWSVNFGEIRPQIIVVF